MTKYTAFSKSACQSLSAELKSVLAKYGVESNLEFSVGSMRFSAESVEIKIGAKVVGGKSRSDVALSSAAKMSNLSMEARNGKQLVGYNSRSYRYPFVYLNTVDGKRYKCSHEMAKMYFGS